MTEQWQELKEIIIELRDNNGVATQQEVCKFLANYMNILEKQMVDPQESEDGELTNGECIEKIVKQDEDSRVIFNICDFEPVEDKPGYVWFSKRNFQIISIETLQKLLEKTFGRK